MLFDMGIGELLIIGVVGLIIFGPERLPKAAAQAAQFLRQLRDQANQAKSSIIEAADIDESTLRDLRDLDPRRALRDVATPLEDIRRMASNAARIEPSALTGIAAGNARASSPEPADVAAPPIEEQRPTAFDQRDII